MNLKQVFNLIKQHTGNTDIIAMDPLLIDFSGSICGGIFLSKLLYWSDKGRLEDGWIAKTYLEWYEETRLTEKQIRLVIKNLTGKGVETAVKKFNGNPTLHYRILPEVFAAAFQAFLPVGSLPKGSIVPDQRAETNPPKGQNESGKKGRLEPAEKADSYTKTTTKTTTDIVLLKKNQNCELGENSTNSEKNLSRLIRKEKQLHFYQQKKLRTPRGAREIFEKARQLYPGRRNGPEVEWENFAKKYPKDQFQTANRLRQAIQTEIAWRQEAAAYNACQPRSPVHIPFWAHFSTYVNQQRWTQELETIPDQVQPAQAESDISQFEKRANQANNIAKKRDYDHQGNRIRS